MAEDDVGGLKLYIRRKFAADGGLTYNGIAYAQGEVGLKLFADAVWADGGYDNVVITQNGFQGGYAQGSSHVPRKVLLDLIEQILEELGFGVLSSHGMMMFGDYSGGLAGT